MEPINRTTLREYLVKLNTQKLERVYLEIFAMLEERDLKAVTRNNKKKKEEVEQQQQE